MPPKLSASSKQASKSSVPAWSRLDKYLSTDFKNGELDIARRLAQTLSDSLTVPRRGIHPVIQSTFFDSVRGEFWLTVPSESAGSKIVAQINFRLSEPSDTAPAGIYISSKGLRTDSFDKSNVDSICKIAGTLKSQCNLHSALDSSPSCQLHLDKGQLDEKKVYTVNLAKQDL